MVVCLFLLRLLTLRKTESFTIRFRWGCVHGPMTFSSVFSTECGERAFRRSAAFSKAYQYFQQVEDAVFYNFK